MIEKIELYCLKKAPLEPDGGHKLFAEIYGGGRSWNYTPGVLDGIDVHGIPSAESAEHPICQRVLKEWAEFQNKRTQVFKQNRSM